MARKSKTDNERALVKRIQHYVHKGINSEEGDVTSVRQDMFERYYGEAFGNEREGFSQYVSREVLETVEWCLPSIMRVFLGGQRAVEFAATGAYDEDQARHETDVVNYWFYNGTEEDSGFMTLYSWIKDILMYPNGYVKVSVRETTEEETTNFRGVSEPDLRALQAKDDVDVVIRKEYPSDQTGKTIYDIAVTEDVFQRGIEVIPLPPDEVIVAHNHTRLNLDGGKFICHRARKTRSDLMELGYTEKELEDLAPADTETWNSEEIARHFYADEIPTDDDRTFEDESDERVWVHDIRIRYDDDGDGVSELREILMAGTKILKNEPTDYVDIVAASAIHITHKHIGMGYAEIVSDLQELTSTLTRQMLDNIYKQNVQRKYVAEAAITTDNKTMEDMLDGRAEVITVRGAPGESLLFEPPNSVVAELGQVITEVRNLPQMRTGVAPTLTLDPSVLEKSSMGAFLGALEHGSQRLELLTRLFAETGFKRVFQKIHYLLRNHFDEPQQVKIAGKWVTADPSTWKRRSNLSVNVGLGFNNKQVMIALLTQLLGIQKEAMAAGLADQKTIFNTFERLIEQANLGNASTYFLDPNEPGWKPPQPQPDAPMILTQAHAQSLAADAKRKDAETQDKIQENQARFKWEQQNQTEQDQFKANEQTQKIAEHALNVRDKVSQIALRDAQIQNLNAQAQKAGIPPEDPTAADEFKRAEGEATAAKAEPASAPAASQSDPGIADLAKAITSHS